MTKFVSYTTMVLVAAVALGIMYLVFKPNTTIEQVYVESELEPAY